MFTTKKKKIKKYLEKKEESDYSTFDLLLFDYLDGSLKEYLSYIKIKKIEIHIDWLEDIKCIGIQGRYNEYFLDLQIYPNEFSISFDTDEPDDDTTHPLESKEQLYKLLSSTIKAL
jgi:hypothetical protein